MLNVVFHEYKAISVFQLFLRSFLLNTCQTLMIRRVQSQYTNPFVI